MAPKAIYRVHFFRYDGNDYVTDRIAHDEDAVAIVAAHRTHRLPISGQGFEVGEGKQLVCWRRDEALGPLGHQLMRSVVSTAQLRPNVGVFNTQ